MSRRPVSEMAVIRAEWLRLMEDAEYRAKSGEERAEIAGVQVNTVYKWERELPVDQWDKWLEDSRKKYARHFLKVDAALLRRAQEDTASADLAYKRLEGWSPKSEQTNINRNAELEGKTDAELRAEILKAIPKEELEAALKEKELKVVEPEKKAQNGEG